MLKKLAVSSVRKGMFVSELDCSWSESPFQIQGFVVENEKHIEQIKVCCNYVIIDSSRSIITDEDSLSESSEDSSPETVEIIRKMVVKSSYAAIPSDLENNNSGKSEDCLPELEDDQVLHLFTDQGRDASQILTDEDDVRPLSAKVVHDALGLPGQFIDYVDAKTIESELVVAKQVHSDLELSISASFNQLQQQEDFEFKGLQESTGNLVSSMIRNPNASFLLSQLKSKDSYSYTHSIDAAILSVLFGRHLGLPESELNSLAFGTLLLDIGKMKLPTELLEKKGRLTAEDISMLKSHVTYSTELVQQIADINLDVIDIVASHHERFNGKGYPRGLKGIKIPVFARIVGIIDFYDAITHPRPYRKAIKPSQAIHELYKRRGTQFQKELVEEFIQCLGVYPTGTIVELSTGEVGIVISQNKRRRLRPTVMVVRDELKNEVSEPFDRNLEVERYDANGQRLRIKTALSAGDYGISKDEYYL